MKNPILILSVLAWTLSAENLSKNPSFDKDLSGWNLFIPGESKDKGVTNTWVAGAGRNGSGAVFLQSKEFARWGWTPAIGLDVKPGDRFHLKAWVRLAPGAEVKSGTPGFFIRATANSADNKPADHPVVLPDSSVSSISKMGAGSKPLTTEWREVAGIVTIPDGATKLGIDLMPHYLKGGVYLDDVFFEKVLATAAAAPATGLLANPGFEKGLEGWNNADDGGMSTVGAEAARSGKSGLRVVDDKDNAGSSLQTPIFPVSAGKKIKLTYWARAVKGGDGLGVYVRVFDAAGKILNAQPKEDLSVPGNHPEWKAYTLTALVPADGVKANLWIHSFSKAKATVDLDDFALSIE